jgi:hypothetical protein
MISPSAVKVLTVKLPVVLVLEGVVSKVICTQKRLVEEYDVYPLVILILLPVIVLLKEIFAIPFFPVTPIELSKEKSAGIVMSTKNPLVIGFFKVQSKSIETDVETTLEEAWIPESLITIELGDDTFNAKMLEIS